MFDDDYLEKAGKGHPTPSIGRNKKQQQQQKQQSTKEEEEEEETETERDSLHKVYYRVHQFLLESVIAF